LSFFFSSAIIRVSAKLDPAESHAIFKYATCVG
jgi:hypothetical protein